MVDQRTAAGASAGVMPQDAHGGIRRFVWRVWPWMNWILPVFLVLSPFLRDGGGWDTVMLLISSPILIPAAGLLGALPRFVLRKRGHVSAPGPIIWLLFVHWWGWIVFAITMVGQGDSGELPSILSRYVHAPIALWFVAGVHTVALVVTVLAWVAVLVAALLLPAPTAAPRLAWDIVSWTAAVAVPVLVIATVVIGVQLTSQQRDAAGETIATVEAMTPAAQVERARDNYNASQKRLAAVRSVIAKDGWKVRNADGRWDGGGLRAPLSGCEQEAADCYAFVLNFQRNDAPVELDDAAFRKALSALGWDLSGHGTLRTATDADGYRLEITKIENRFTRVSLQTPTWWGDDDRLGRELGELSDTTDPGRTYGSDDWPQL